jgi:hypothetical protein
VGAENPSRELRVFCILGGIAATGDWRCGYADVSGY